MPSIRARATVLSLEANGDRAWADLAVDSEAACQRCKAGRGCGAGAFSTRDGQNRVRVEVPGEMTLAAGDVVSVEANSRSLLEASAAAYGLPLVGMLAAALLGHFLGLGEGIVVTFAAAGLGAGFIAGRRHLGAVCWQDELRLTGGAGETRQ